MQLSFDETDWVFAYREIETLWNRISELEHAVKMQNPSSSKDVTNNYDQSLSEDGEEHGRIANGQCSSPSVVALQTIGEGGRVRPVQEEQRSQILQPNFDRQPGDSSQGDNLGDQSAMESLHMPNSTDQPAQGDCDASSENHSQRSRDNGTQDRGSSVVSGKLSQECPQGDDEVYFYGEPSTASLMQEVHETFSLSPNHADMSSNTAPSRMGSSVYSQTDIQQRREGTVQYLNSKNLTTQNPMNAFYLPRRSLADHLLDCYFSRVHILYPFLHQATLQAAYEKLWDPANNKNVNDSGLNNISSFPGIGLGNFIDSNPESKVFSCGMNAIFALSCQFSDVPILKTREAAKGYLERAMSLLVDTETLDKPNISLVQVLLLLGVFLQSTSLAERCWHVIGLACRMAQGLGLHIEAGNRCLNEKNPSNLEVEVRRRVWYTCVMLDTTVSMTLGRVSMMSDGFSTPLPRAINEENLSTSSESLLTQQSFQTGFCLTSFFIEAIKLTELTSKLVGFLYRKPVQSGKNSTDHHTELEKNCTVDLGAIISLENSWIRLSDSLPASLRWSKEGTTTSDPPDGETEEPRIISKSLERQRNVLHARFLYVKILLYRPLFIQLCHERIPQNEKFRHAQAFRKDTVEQEIYGRPEETSTPVLSFFKIRCSTACFWAADELLHLVRKSHSTDTGSAWWYKLYYVYNSGIVIILTRFCRPLMEILGIPRIEESWVLCQDILKDLAMYGRHANRCLVGLKDLRSRVSTMETEPQATVDESRNAHFIAESLNLHPASADAAGSRKSRRHEYGEGSFTPPTNTRAVETNSDINFDISGIIGSDGLDIWDVDFDSWWNTNIFNLGPDL